MTNAIRIGLIAAAGLAMTACATNSSYDSGGGSSSLREASNAAESACMSAVNSQYGGNVKTVSVASSEFSQANSVVMVNAAGVRGGSMSERWRCLVSNDGNVEELTVVQ